MFYNTFRTTKSSLREAEKNKLAGAGQTIVSHRERLLNLQKRQKLKDLLITKFMHKYGIKNPEKILEDEITKFLQGQKLTDADLKRLDFKVKKLLSEKASKEKLKNSLTQSLPEIPTNKGINLINKKTNLNINDTPLGIDNTLASNRGKSQQRILSTEPGISTLNQPKLSSSMYSPVNRYRKVYKSPEEELAELEAEFVEEEKKNNKRYERLDFSNEGDEWNAIAQYNRKLYEEQIKEEKMKDNELKRRNREDLDLQVKQKLRREYEEELKDKEYDNIVQEHQKKMDELEKEKLEALKKQMLKEKEMRDAQMKDNYIRKRIETLKNQKFERGLVKTIRESIENEKKQAIEEKKRKNEALIKAIKENEIKIKNKLEKEKQQKEEDIKMSEERIKMDMKQEIARNRYYESIKKNGELYDSTTGKELIEKLKKEEEEEDKKVQFYYEEKNRLAIEKEKEAEIKKQKDKRELKKYLDMQIEEKRKEEEFLKSLDNEQARIWAIDCKKYNEDQIAIEKKIRAMNKRNLTLLKEQMNLKKSNKKNTMSDTEYAMNRDTLEKAKAASLANNQK